MANNQSLKTTSVYRIEIYSKVEDARGLVKLRKFKSWGFDVKSVDVVDIYTIDKSLTATQLKEASESLFNPVSQTNKKTDSGFDWAIESGFLPGVTDNIGKTAQEIIEDLLKIKFSKGETVYSSQLLLISGQLAEKEIQKLSLSLINPLIQRAHIKSASRYKKDGGMDVTTPKVILDKGGKTIEVDLNVSDQELITIGKAGIADPDKGRRGPLALSLPYMKAIQAFFKKLGRNPTDIELESLAQTWSEHCKHTIFADPLDDLTNGLFKTYIKGATEKIREAKGKEDYCVSVFTDNSGAIDFDQGYLVTHKAETHNSPSALDPFGGAITGIVGVNRDALGFGLGAKPIINTYGFMFGDPEDKKELFKDEALTERILSPRRIMDGVIEGVNAGGNQSGIPTPQGFVYFDDRYKGKPLVFVGTLGLIPKRINGKASIKKKAKPGDLIIMLGGKVGLDGIHGATFSSEALTSGSPATAVQIGDPITQKKLSDALVRDVRDLDLYNSITDNGAGGLSCSVAEMAKESGGCKVNLEKVPLKYPGLDPWQIWISESQERMTLAVPKNKWPKFKKIMDSRGVEATIIGEFTKSGSCQVFYNGKKVMDVKMEFLHNGLPKRQQKSSYKKPKYQEPRLHPTGLGEDLLNLLARKNIASFEFISSQYDHDVQGGSVLKPMIGAGGVNGEATITRPLLTSKKGVVLSQGYFPSYSEIDPYNMASAAIDTAVRNVIIAGANPEKIALLDNFCWCSSNEPQRLGELKKAVKACYDIAIAYGTPYISGKDSMFNDFKGFDPKGNPLKISVPPTLLISSLGVIEDVEKAVSLDFKKEGDLIYLLGETKAELGGSEYALYLSNNDPTRIGNKTPSINTKKQWRLYKKVALAIDNQLISAGIAVTRGGMGVAFSKMSMAGKLGADVFLKDGVDLFSESLGRFVVTISAQNQKRFEQTMKGVAVKLIGQVNDSNKFKILNRKKKLINLSVSEMLGAYKKTFKDY